MTRYTRVAAALAGILLFAAGCQKKDDGVKTPPIVINILSPVVNQEYRKGDTLQLNATISSPVDLHGYIWRVNRRGTTTALYAVNEHTHERTFTITGKWAIDSAAVAASELDLTITAEIDHEGNEVSKTIPIIAKP